MKQRSLSLKQKYLITVLGVVLAFLFSASFIWGHVYRYYLKKTTAANAGNLIERTYEDFEKSLKEINYYLAVLDYNSEIQNILNKEIARENKEKLNDHREVEDILFSKLIGSTRLVDITLVSGSGEYYTSRGRQPFGSEQLDVFRSLASKQGKTVCYVEPQEKEDDLSEIILIRRMQYCGKGTMAIVTMNGSELINGYREKMEFPYAVLLKEKESGRLLYRYTQGRAEDSWKELMCMGADFQDGITEDFRAAGEKYLAVSMSYEDFGWQTTVLIPNAEMEKEYRGASMITGTILILLTLTAILLIRVIAERYSRNIRELTDAIQHVDSSALELPVAIDSGDEVEVLYRRFKELLLRIREQMEIIRRDEKEKKKLEIRALQAQINPHFLANSLTTIKVMAMMHGAQSIAEASDALSAVMRVNMSRQEYVTFEQEIQYLKSYICMREYQSAYGIHFVCEVEPELLDFYVLKLLIQPVVENAIKHGGILDKPDGRISLRAYRAGNAVKIEVSDNGTGLSEEEGKAVMENLEEGNGVGLYNIQRRLELNYGPDYGIQIYGEKGCFTVVEFTVPVIERIGEEA